MMKFRKHNAGMSACGTVLSAEDIDISRGIEDAFSAVGILSDLTITPPTYNNLPGINGSVINNPALFNNYAYGLRQMPPSIFHPNVVNALNAYYQQQNLMNAQAVADTMANYPPAQSVYEDYLPYMGEGDSGGYSEPVGDGGYSQGVLAQNIAQGGGVDPTTGQDLTEQSDYAAQEEAEYENDLATGN